MIVDLKAFEVLMVKEVMLMVEMVVACGCVLKCNVVSIHKMVHTVCSTQKVQ